MTPLFRFFYLFLLLPLALMACKDRSETTPAPDQLQKQLSTEKAQVLDQRLSAKNLQRGNAVFMRIFKKEKTLELWMQPKGQETFVLFHTYPICYFSGALGPKQKEGDKQSPEGFYAVGQKQLNPNSSYHLSFNLGFPNAYDRATGYTGSYLMVHGKCVSVGCYAMTDPQIEEIYALAEAALQSGQPFFRVHAFPFQLTDENLAAYQHNPWFDFWQMLQEGYLAFERSHIPPNIEVVNNRYKVCTPPAC